MWIDGKKAKRTQKMDDECRFILKLNSKIWK